MTRPPWSRRRSEQAAEQFFVLRTGVPDGLLTSLLAFVIPAFYAHDDYGFPVPIRSKVMQFARVTDRHLPDNPDSAAQVFSKDHDFLLDAVDFVLGDTNPNVASPAVAELYVHLQEARSAYTVGRDGNSNFELQDRQPESLTSIVAEATSGRDRAADHLQRAWSLAFGRDRDPTSACVDAVKAIEVAAKPIVSPNNDRATLGTIIADMRAKPSKWTTDSEAEHDVEDVITMMNMVWTGHFRHGDETKPIDVSAPGAEMLVQLAALLVHWFHSGLIRPA